VRFTAHVSRSASVALHGIGNCARTGGREQRTLLLQKRSAVRLDHAADWSCRMRATLVLSVNNDRQLPRNT
jgi:hypothetical protein